MLRATITQCRQIVLFAVGVSLLAACGNSQSGMKLGDSEYAVLAVNSDNILSSDYQRYAGYRGSSPGVGFYC